MCNLEGHVEVAGLAEPRLSEEPVLLPGSF